MHINQSFFDPTNRCYPMNYHPWRWTSTGGLTKCPSLGAKPARCSDHSGAGTAECTNHYYTLLYFLQKFLSCNTLCAIIIVGRHHKRCFLSLVFGHPCLLWHAVHGNIRMQFRSASFYRYSVQGLHCLIDNSVRVCIWLLLIKSTNSLPFDVFGRAVHPFIVHLQYSLWSFQ